MTDNVKSVTSLIWQVLVIATLLLSIGWQDAACMNFCKYNVHFGYLSVYVSCVILMLRKSVFVPKGLLGFAIVLFLWCSVCNIKSHCRLVDDGQYIFALVAFCMVSSQLTTDVWRRLTACFTVVIAFLCLLQLTGVFGEIPLFDNNAGWAAALCLGSVSVSTLSFERKGLSLHFCVGVAVLLVIACCLYAVSRSGLLAFVVSQFCLLVHLKNVAFLKVLVLCVLICFGGVWLYNRNRDSADGRKLIYRTCWSLCKKSPVAGYGAEAIAAHYMLQQAKVLRSENDKRCSWLASDVNHAFNEPLNLVLRYGFVGLLLVCMFLAYCFMRSVNEAYWREGFCVTVAYSVTGLFSYPSAYPYVCFLLAGSFSQLFSRNFAASVALRLRGKAVLAALLFLAIYIEGNSLRYGLAWKESNDFCENGNVQEGLHRYEELLPSMQTNGRFLYNYAVHLNSCQRYVESSDVLKLAEHHLCTYDTEMLAGDNALSLDRYDLAMRHFAMAHLMVPVRFMPLYGLLQTAMQKGDSLSAKSYAQTICRKPVKVFSSEIHDIKLDAKSVLYKLERKP